MDKHQDEKYLAEALRNINLAISYLRAFRKFEEAEKLEKAKVIMMDVYDVF